MKVVASGGRCWFVTYMLKVNMSLAGYVIDHVPDLLLPAATDEVLLGHTMLRTHAHIHRQWKVLDRW